MRCTGSRVAFLDVRTDDADGTFGAHLTLTYSGAGLIPALRTQRTDSRPSLLRNSRYVTSKVSTLLDSPACSRPLSNHHAGVLSNGARMKEVHKPLCVDEPVPSKVWISGDQWVASGGRSHGGQSRVRALGG